MLQSLIDRFGFAIAIIVQIGMVTVSMIGLSPNSLVAIGYIGLGVAAVLFAPRSFQKYLETGEIRYLINWALFALFTVFIGISFALAGSVQQNEVSSARVTIENDAALSAYESDLDQAISLREQLKDEYDQTRGADLLDNIQSRQIANDEEILRLQRKVEERRDLILSGQATRELREQEGKIASDTVFTSILNSFPSPVRIIQLFFWSLLMVGTELMVINSLQETYRKVEKVEALEPQLEEGASLEKESVPAGNNIFSFVSSHWPINSEARMPTVQRLEKAGIKRERQRELISQLTEAGIAKVEKGHIVPVLYRDEAIDYLRRVQK